MKAEKYHALNKTPGFWQRSLHRKSTLAFFLLLLSVGGCKDIFACKGDPVGPDPGSGQGAFEVAKIARWDGDEWHSLGKGVTSIEDEVAAVHDIVVHENLVYVAGEFDFAGEYEVNSIARWSGNSWQGFGNLALPGVHLGTPTNRGAVNAVVLTGSGAGTKMFVGGNFYTVYNEDVLEGLNTNNLAFFDFSSSLWRTMDEGVDGEANALAANESVIYVGGAFQSANNLVNTGLIAQWNAFSGGWTAVGTGLYGVAVHALLVNGNDL